jgi:hypothetical protein
LPQPLGELAALRQREDRLLHGYAWVDRQAGIVRIPIDDAIDLVASRGLPARADRAQPPEPVPSASGRFVRERPR